MLRPRRCGLSRRKGQRGQTATEYLMVVSAIVVASAAATYYVFDSDNGPIKDGLNSLLDEDGSSPVNINQQVKQGFVDPNPM